MATFNLRFTRQAGMLPADVLSIYAAALSFAEGALLAAQWEASQAAGDWNDWRAMTAGLQNGSQDAAIVGRIYPGGLAVVWPPQLAAESARHPAIDAIHDQLVQQFVAWLEEEPVSLLQATMPSGDLSAETLLRNGFFLAAELFYLACPAECFPAARPVTELQFDAVSPESRVELATVVEATYQQTLDVPALNGLRSAEEVLAGYEATGNSGTKHWRLIRLQNQTVGCLILAEHAPQQLLELVYMGITPAARGKRAGEATVAYAQSLARELNCQQLVLTVDAANFPARRIYDAAGFQRWDSRLVLLRRVFREA